MKSTAELAVPDGTEQFRILHFWVKNFQGIVEMEVSLDPSDPLIQFTGGNGEGKTSAVNALFWAFVGARALPKEPVRHGAECAECEVNVGPFTIYRKVDTAGETTLKITPNDGRKYRNTEEMLKSFFGTFAISADMFKRLDGNKQFEYMIDLLPLEVDLAALDAERKEYYDKRTRANQEVDRYKKLGETYSDLPAIKPDIVDVSALNEERRKRRTAEDAAFLAEETLSRQLAEVDAGQVLIERMKQKLAETEAEQQQRLEDLPTASDEVERAQAVLADGSLMTMAEIDAKTLDATKTNDTVLKCNARDSDAEQLADWTAESKRLTTEIARVDKVQGDALAACVMPIDGLTVHPEKKELRYKGTLLKSCSDSEEAIVSAAVAMATESALKVLHIHGDDLDEASLAKVYDQAAASGYQCVVDHCDTSGEVGIVIKEGRVQAINKQFHPSDDNESWLNEGVA